MKKRFSHLFTGDKDIEQFIGIQLRVGVVAASIIVFVGGIFYLLHAGVGPIPPYHTFTGEHAEFTTLNGIFHGLAQAEPKALIQLGVAILIATPVLRIFFSLIGFIMEKDKLYILITTIVLFIMILSISGVVRA